MTGLETTASTPPSTGQPTPLMKLAAPIDGRRLEIEAALTLADTLGVPDTD